jgi:hypothetical protein
VADRLHRFPHGDHGRDHDALDRIINALDDLEDLNAVDLGQADIEQDQVDGMFFDQTYGFLARLRRRTS